MRSEEAMLRLIVDIARNDERIRAAYLEGSRANPAAPRDLFQDYDVVYIVAQTHPFISDRAWIDRFGERLAMQLPEESPLYPSEPDACYGWLMQLADGVRLDLHGGLRACQSGAVPDSARQGRHPAPARGDDGCALPCAPPGCRAV